ncbi:NAD(P)/FAD-dependent oxidoreductase [Actinomadura fibrosa]|uniref:NAD(P)/FAD-dependent oxidoreductase n=1 Tax=Actinomadura fibrosa TaxID=111802 RepID=A0ABW2XNR0_9ACTN|nr:NAD(P)/FAD-dependent oxidoreductase [Actinomadura fibrosa]
MDTNERQYDVIVVGGGAAGLGAAATLARARRAVLVVDAGEPRNAPADGVHNFLGSDGTPPGELLARGRKEVVGYGGEIVDGTVSGARHLDDGFQVDLEGGRSVRSRRLLVTTGLVDELPDVPGLAERFGRDALHCPYCHGWEVRDRRIGVLATAAVGVEQALLWRQWSADVTLLVHTGPAPDGEARERLDARGITVADGTVTGLRVEDDRLIGAELDGGRVVPLDALVVAPRFVARSAVLTGLGLKATEMVVNGHVMGERIETGPGGATAVPGVWAAGNVADLAETVIGSAAAGVRAAGMINADLVAEDTRLAVAAREVPFSATAERANGERVRSGRGHGW